MKTGPAAVPAKQPSLRHSLPPPAKRKIPTDFFFLSCQIKGRAAYRAYDALNYRAIFSDRAIRRTIALLFLRLLN
jgi:hypothetical protein